MARALAAVHAERGSDDGVWSRRLHELVGDSRGIMGLTGSYVHSGPHGPAARFIDLEQSANAWRHRLEAHAQRLCRIYGDLQTTQIMCGPAGGMRIVRRDPTVWGEAAEDVAAVTSSYILFALHKPPDVHRTFGELHGRFWEAYLSASGDADLVTIAQPWLARRALILANPQLYPEVDEAVRSGLLRYAGRVMGSEIYDYARLELYLEDVV
ncbi:MAG: hypothetical protein GF355_10525 [Candidatus Eisenbacteria bacterium]|nr:hypothetical protein [Candidatus Eisenbacteria bacterium]